MADVNPLDVMRQAMEFLDPAPRARSGPEGQDDGESGSGKS